MLIQVRIKVMSNVVGFISFSFILVVKQRTLWKVKLRYCSRQEPKWRADREGSFHFWWWRKTLFNYLPGQNRHNQVGTGNLIYIVPPRRDINWGPRGGRRGKIPLHQPEDLDGCGRGAPPIPQEAKWHLALFGGLLDLVTLDTSPLTPQGHQRLWITDFSIKICCSLVLTQLDSDFLFISSGIQPLESLCDKWRTHRQILHSILRDWMV